MPPCSRRILSTGLLLLLPVCASLPALARRCDGLRPAHLERLYFGRNVGDRVVVSDSAWQQFVRETLTPAFPEGATIWDARGQWRDPEHGTTVREGSFVVELIHLVTADVEAQVSHVIAEYKRRFSQQSVLRVVTDVRASF